MTQTTSFLQNLARRDAHRLAQKISVLAMVGLVLLCQWTSALQGVATPDALMATLLVGLLAYALANRVTRSLVGANRCSEEELLLMFVIDDLH
jgi:hypothetical protein